MGNNEEKTDISLKRILTVLNRLHHDEKTQETRRPRASTVISQRCETLHDIHFVADRRRQSSKAVDAANA